MALAVETPPLRVCEAERRREAHAQRGAEITRAERRARPGRGRAPGAAVAAGPGSAAERASGAEPGPVLGLDRADCTAPDGRRADGQPALSSGGRPWEARRGVRALTRAGWAGRAGRAGRAGHGASRVQGARPGRAETGSAVWRRTPPPPQDASSYGITMRNERGLTKVPIKDRFVKVAMLHLSGCVVRRWREKSSNQESDFRSAGKHLANYYYLYQEGAVPKGTAFSLLFIAQLLLAYLGQFAYIAVPFITTRMEMP